MSDDMYGLARDVISSRVMGVIHPVGALARAGEQMDRVLSHRMDVHPEGAHTPTVRSEHELLTGLVAVVHSLWDTVMQIDMSLKQSPPTLAMLMERDVAFAMIGTASEWGLELGVSLGEAFRAQNPEDDGDEVPGPLGKLLSALGASPGGDRREELESLISSILGDVKMIDESAATLAGVLVGNNPWYVQAVVSLTSALGGDLRAPAGLPERVRAWTP